MRFAILKGKVIIPIEDPIEWSRSLDIETRKLGDDTINGVWVSTVFLGVDHGFWGTPLWFETMIFGGKHNNYQRRYATFDEAIQGHDEALELVKSEMAEDVTSE